MNILKAISICILAIVSFNGFAEQWELQKRVEPRYPLQAVKNNIEGCVVVQFFIDHQGQPQYVEPIQSSVKDIFDGEAYKAISKWRYSATDNNPNSLPERKVVRLDFALSKEPLINDECQAVLTNEVNDIEKFKENRLLTPIDSSSDITFKKSMALISTVLTPTELKRFVMSMAAITPSQELNRAEIQQEINGLNYYQILSTVNISHEQTNTLVEKRQVRIERKLHTIPLVNDQKFINLWEISDMPIMIEESLYKEISYQLLKAEVLVRIDGTAELISTCRNVSEDITEAIKASIADWRISSKSNPPHAVRYIYGIPAEVEPGAYYDCDEDWYPEHETQLPIMRANQ